MARTISARMVRRRVPPKLPAHPFGCGVDVVEVARFRQAVKRWGDVLLKRIYTTTELSVARARRDRLTHLAARFAAKESVIKAMAQVAPESPLHPRQVEIRNDQLGRPYVILHGFPPTLFAIHVSLSHADHVTVASAIVSR